MNKQTQNNGQRNHFWKKFIRKPVSLYLNAIRVTLPKSWVGPREWNRLSMAKYSRLHLSQIWAGFSKNFLKSKVNDTFIMTWIKFPFQNVISLTVILKIMYLRPLKTSLSRLCYKTGHALRREENKAIESFEGSFRNLNFSPSTSILLNFFFPFIDIRCFFFVRYKTSVLSNNRFAKEA